jgi:hypothetical protein
LALFPWVQAGIVEIIHAPDDFDPKLKWDSLKLQEKKIRDNPELKRVLETTVKQTKDRHVKKEAFRDLILSAPDTYLRRKYKEFELEQHGLSENDFLQHIQVMREEDPDFLEPLDVSGEPQLRMFTSGANYEIARLTAELTNSYLVTDLDSRWWEI